ncbi:GTP-binding protein [Pseudomonas saudimassiliensis]|uniref:GTP-binding protein n=1 Tax=Pseudomonas saudimassiliensis TaxID=1461581 RepID=A0A078M8S2_9PSED|nr:YdgA family protein [Pseudomonas saudimassiliensis]CEA03833.1 GTP-binding protein [Pseudomonas saudimassiliensis]CEF26322.1 GTP-binding protein [Pseudomonas saudimassiliensis]
MNKAGIAAGTLALLVAAAGAGSWYTGTQLESVLRDSVGKANQQLAAQFPGSEMALEIVEFKRGVLASEARYRLALPASGDDAAPSELFIRDRIEHGPLPLSRLVSLRWMPVMAVSHAELEPSEALSGLFAASRERAPVMVNSSIGYRNDITGNVRVAPMTHVEDDIHLSFSGLDAQFATDTLGSRVVMNGRVDSLTIEGDEQANLVGVEFELDRRREGEYGLYLGDGQMTLDSIAMEGPQGPTLVLQDIVQTDSTTLGADGVKGVLNVQMGAISYAGKPLGSLRMDWSLSRLDPAATATLGGVYNTFSMGIEPDDTSALQEQVVAALEQLLQGKPRLALDNLSIRTANGESRFNLGVDFNQPVSFDLEPGLLAQQLVGGLDANLTLSKPMLSDMVRYRALFEPGADAAAVEQEAQMAAEMAGGMAEMMQLGRIEGDNILSSLRYADGMIDLNGQSIPLEDFLGLLAMMSPEASSALLE